MFSTPAAQSHPLQNPCWIEAQSQWPGRADRQGQRVLRLPDSLSTRSVRLRLRGSLSKKGVQALAELRCHLARVLRDGFLRQIDVFNPQGNQRPHAHARQTKQRKDRLVAFFARRRVRHQVQRAWPV